VCSEAKGEVLGNFPRCGSGRATAYFFERNPPGRGLDFDEFPEHKAEFLRYAVQFHCVNPVKGITKCPLPLLEEIARGTSIQL
jgi:hypothetical protein